MTYYPLDYRLLKHQTTKYRNLRERMPESVFSEDRWGIGLCLACLTVERPLEFLANFSCELDFSLRFDDPTVAYVIRKCFNQNRIEEGFVQRNIRGWIGIINHDYNVSKFLTINDLIVLHSGLQLNCVQCRLVALNHLFELSTVNSVKVKEYLQSTGLLERFLILCTVFDLESCYNLYNGFLSIIKLNLDEPGFKESLPRLNLLSCIVNCGLALNDYCAIIEISKFIIENNTLTLLQMLIYNDIHLRSNNDFVNNEDYTLFIDTTSPFFGFIAPEFIADYGQKMEYSNSTIISMFTQVPFYFKIESSEYILTYILKSLDNINQIRRSELKILLRAVVWYLADILCFTDILLTSNYSGRCCKHESDFFMVKTGPSRLLKRCRDCNIVICHICSNEFHSLCNTEFLYYQRNSSPCQCSESHQYRDSHYNFILPEYPEDTEFLLSDNPIVNENTLAGSMTNKITTRFPLISNIPYSMHYFEVKILRAGSHEKILIEALGPDISLQISSGLVKVKEREIMKAPRAGSYDTIGIGLIEDRTGFVTYNGLIVHPFFECEASESFIPVIYMDSSDCEIQIQLKSWLFSPGKGSYLAKLINPHTSLTTNLDHIFNILDNQIKKLQNTDSYSMELFTRYQEVLAYLNFGDRIQKLQRKISIKGLFTAGH